MRYLLPLLVLVLFASAVQGVVVSRAVVPALDSVRFLVTAEWMDREGMLQTVRSQSEQPLYAVWVWGVRHAVLATVGSFPALGAVTVQLAAAVPLVLSVVPLYFLSLRVYGQGAAVAGTFLFCLLPEVARLGADGISDSTHLLLFAFGFWGVLAFLCGPGGRGAMADFHAEPQSRPWTPGRPRWMLWAGLATGLAILVRAESLMLPVALVVGLVAVALVPSQRRLIPHLLWGGVWFGVGLLTVLGPYLVLTGATTPHRAATRLLGRAGPARLSSPAPTLSTDARDWPLATAEPLCFAPKDASSSRRRGLGGAVRIFGRELVEAFWYWVGLLGLVGLWIARRLRPRPVDWFVRIFAGLLCAGVLAFGVREGYLSARHLLLLVTVGIGACGFGAVEGALALSRWRRLAWGGRCLRPGLSVAATLALVGGACLVQTLLPVGREAAAHRAASRWLLGQPVAGTVIDTKGWSRLYSGRKTYQYADGAAAFADPGVSFVVVEPWELQGDSPRTRTLCRLLATAGEWAAEFAGAGGQSRRGVIVYRWRPERFRRGMTALTTDAQRVHDARTSASLCPERR